MKSIASKTGRWFASSILVALLCANPCAQEKPDPLLALGELVELDLPQEIVTRFGARVQPTGDLHDNQAARALVARAYFQIGQETAADDLLKDDGANQENSPAIVVSRAWIAMQRDDLKQALKLLLISENGSSKARYPDDPEALILLARVFARRGDPFRAETAAQRFLALAPLHPQAHTALHILAQAAIERGEPQAAAELFVRRDAARQWQELLKVRRLQIRRAPDDPLPRMGLALLWMEVEQWQRARDQLAALVQRWPQEARAWFHLGECERALEHKPQALVAYERALQVDPDHAPSRANHALLLITLDRPTEAQAELELLLKGPAAKDPRYAPAHLALARLLLDSQGQEAAQARYKIYRTLGGTQALQQ